MELTGKCKEDFKKWYRNSVELPFGWNFNPSGGITVCPELRDFMNLPPSMQYGVYVDFFDSVGIHLEIELKWPDPYPWGVNYTINGTKWLPCGIPNHFETRDEARQKAIEKANEIYNQTHE